MDRLAGLLLFLPVPLVLVLFTRAPLGLLPSFAIAIAVMVSHRLYARPWAVLRARRRCLWCGAPTVDGCDVPLREPAGGAVAWRACGAPHRERALSFLGWAERHARLLKGGILGGLVVLLAGTVLAARGVLGAVVPADAADVFRLSVAVAVLPLGWLGPRARAAATEPAVPFPVHIQALVGTIAVVWLFRLIGIYWLVDAVWGLARRHLA